MPQPTNNTRFRNIDRLEAKNMKEGLKDYPVIVLVGARRTGKSTLCDVTYPGYDKYLFTMDEDISEVKAGPKRYFAKMRDTKSNGIVIDEIQNVKELIPCIAYDMEMNPDDNFKFILSGSDYKGILDAIGDALGGKTRVVNMVPLTYHEIKDYVGKAEMNELLLRGGYPRMWNGSFSGTPDRYMTDIVTTQVEKDFRRICTPAEFQQVRAVMRVMANSVGSEMNFDSISRNLGIKRDVLMNWVFHLEAIGVVFSLPRYDRTSEKTETYPKKFYYYDTGMLCHLRGVTTIRELVSSDETYGKVFENYVISEVKKQVLIENSSVELFYGKGSYKVGDKIHNGELDLVAKKGERLIAFDAKKTSKQNSGLEDNVKHAKEILEAKYDVPGFVVYGGEMKKEPNPRYVNMETLLKKTKQKSMEHGL